jgi:hypothetical protein
MKASDKEVVEDISAFIWGNDKKTRPGEYRIRVGFTYNPNSSLYANLNWSEWLYFRVLPALHTVPHLIEQKNILPGGKITKGQPTTKMINAQPELPGKQVRTLIMPLQVIPFAHRFQAPATVKIGVKNTPFSRIPFELRYRSAAGKPYRQLKHPRHSFARTNGTTNLILTLENIGQYKVRFRANHKAPWTSWQSFQITGRHIRVAMPTKNTKNMKIISNGSRAINPQPEPPGRQVRTHAVRNNGAHHLQAQPRLKLSRQIQLRPPVIKTPKNGQKFLMVAKNMHIKAEITHAADRKIQVELQHEKNRRFLPVKTGIRPHQMKDKTSVDMLITSTGTYRMRIKDTAKRSRWGKWTTFTVGRVMKNMPRLSTKKTAIKLKKQPAHPAAVPAMKLPSSAPLVR